MPLSLTFQAICDGVIGLPIYGFPLMFNSNIGPTNSIVLLTCLTYIRLQSLSDLESLTWTFQGHLRTNVMVPLDSPYSI